MASAMVGLPMISCQRSTGNWLVMMVERASIAVLDDLQKIAALVGVERLRAPVIKNEQIERGRELRSSRAISAVAAREGEGVEEPRHAMILRPSESSRQALWPSAQASQLLPTPVEPTTYYPGTSVRSCHSISASSARR